MRFLKVLGVIALVAVLVYVFKFRNMGQEPAAESIEQVENIEVHDHNHDHDHSSDIVSEDYNHEQVQKDHENKPYYQGEIISLEHGGGYTFLEILESTDMSFWIVVDKVDAKKGDFVMFREDLVAQNFHSKALDRTFDEIMFATDLQYRVSE